MLKETFKTEDSAFKLDLELLEIIYKLNLNEKAAGVNDVAAVYLTQNPHPTITRLKQDENQWHNLSEEDYELVVNINKENRDRIRGLLYDLQDKRFIWNKEMMARARSLRHVFALDYVLTEKGLKHIETYGSLGGLTLVDPGDEGQLSLADQSGALSLKELQEIAKQSLMTEQQLLIESRLSKAIDKYRDKWAEIFYKADPRTAKFAKVTDSEAVSAIKDVLMDDARVNAVHRIKLVSRQDPSGNNKYLDWTLKQIIKDTEPHEEIMTTVREFHDNLARIKKKDIYQYKNTTQLRTAVNEANRGNLHWFREDQIENIIKNDIRWVYKKGSITVAKPMSMEASIYLGHDQCREDQTGVKWCTARRQKDMTNFFPSYSGENTFLYYIIDPSQEFPYKKVAIALTKDNHELGDGYSLEVFDSEDQSIGDYNKTLYRQPMLINTYGNGKFEPWLPIAEAVLKDFGSREYTRLAELLRTDDLNKLHKIFFSGQTSMQTQLLANPNIPSAWVEDAAKNTNKLPKNTRSDHMLACLNHPNAGPGVINHFLPSLIQLMHVNSGSSWQAENIIKTITLAHAKHGGREQAVNAIYNALISEMNTIPKSLTEFVLVTPYAFNDFFSKHISAEQIPGHLRFMVESLLYNHDSDKTSINAMRNILANYTTPETTEILERAAVYGGLRVTRPFNSHQIMVNFYQNEFQKRLQFFIKHQNTSVSYDELYSYFRQMFENINQETIPADPIKQTKPARWYVTGHYLEPFVHVYGGGQRGNSEFYDKTFPSVLKLLIKILKDTRKDVDLTVKNNIYVTFIKYISRNAVGANLSLFAQNVRNELEQYLLSITDPIPEEQALYKAISHGYKSYGGWMQGTKGEADEAYSNKRRAAWEKKHNLDSIDESVLNDIAKQIIKGF
tara:strand:+ start:9884 stop:12586 length:2703 start_codon:yes stop_codon:yes gene_type:complete